MSASQQLPAMQRRRVFSRGSTKARILVEAAVVTDWQPRSYQGYKWIVADPELLGGRLAVRGTRLSVSLILECLANGMTLADINEAYADAFPPEALPEILHVASELTGSLHVAA